MNDLNDLSTWLGRLKLFYFRYKVIILPVSVLLIPVLIIGAAIFTENPLPTSTTSIPILKAAPVIGSSKINQTHILHSSKSSQNKQETNLEILGDSTRPTYNVPGKTTYYQIFDTFPGFNNSTVNLSKITSVTIMWYHLDGPKLGQELGEYFPNLETLRLDNITMDGFLQRTNLPKVKDFYFDQILYGTQEGTTDYAFYKQFENETDWDLYAKVPKFLESVFFFKNSSESFYSQVMKNNVKLSIWQTGSIVYTEDPTEHILRINIPNCHQKIANSAYKELTIGFCFDINSKSIPASTKYLNIYLAKHFSKELYDELLPRLVNLDEMYFELPGTQLDLAALPKSLRILSISSIELVPTNATVPSVKEFYFGGMNEYKFVNSTITNLHLRNFTHHFPNLEKVGIFDVTENRYDILKDLLNTTANIISVHNFQRIDDEGEFGEFLKQIGIGPTETNFVIEKSGLIVIGRGLSALEQIQLRFTNLGWDTVDSWNKYAHVNGLIENGFILGD